MTPEQEARNRLQEQLDWRANWYATHPEKTWDGIDTFYYLINWASGKVELLRSDYHTLEEALAQIKSHGDLWIDETKTSLPRVRQRA